MAASDGQYREYAGGEQSDSPMGRAMSDAHASRQCKIDAGRGSETAVHAAARPVSEAVG